MADSDRTGAAPGFRIEVDQNRYLNLTDRTVHSVLTVTADAGGEPVTTEAAQVILIDCSGSMAHPVTKINAARRAGRAAIDALRDGALFAVVAGTNHARMVYPDVQVLARADDTTRAQARRAVAALNAAGGTAIANWLRLARRLLSEHPAAVRHVILLTDGQDQEPKAVLERELAACAPEFTCDARGIGADWDAEQLMRVTEVLHGTADAIRTPTDLPADFAAMTRSTMAKLVPEVRLVVRPMAGAAVTLLRQTFPTESVLAGERLESGGTAHPTGSWGAERRQYHLSVDIDPDRVTPEQDVRVARVDVQVRPPGSVEFEPAGATGNVFAHRTVDLALSEVVNALHEQVQDAGELGRAVRAGCKAYLDKDVPTATREWGTALALAVKLDNDVVRTRLLRLVDPVGNPADGVVMIRPGVRPEDLLSANTGSVFSVIASEAAVGPGEPVAAGGGKLTCPRCGRVWDPPVTFCGGCATRMDEE